jgi:penicillin V acylase-like amidase (Ntn superfamily)
MISRMKAAVLTLILLYTSGHCECTSFCFVSGDTVLFGNNLDWYCGDGMLVVNKRNVQKAGCWFQNRPAWTSKYGSITINQFGREFPSRGMNEAGLAVGEMTLSETRFPDPDSRPAISQGQWIQYQLDNYASIDEVIAGDAKVRIDLNEYHSHFLVADGTGACISLEWLNGRLVWHARATLPVPVLTNNTYSSALAYLNQNPAPPASDYSSNARFYRAAEMLRRYDRVKDGPMVTFGFAVLGSVGPPNFNKWNLVFDLKNRRFHVRTSANRNIRFVDFNSFDCSCATVVKVFGLDNALSGDVHDAFIDYSYEINRNSINSIFEKVGAYVGYASDWAKETMARYPETTTCRVEGGAHSTPDQCRLRQNFPNPFNQGTEISYRLDGSGDVRVSICSPSGREMNVLFEGKQTAGEHRIWWFPAGIPSGIYVCRFQGGGSAEARKLVLLK